MNTKTTMFLAVALAGLLGLIWVAGPEPGAAGVPEAAPTELLGDKPLIAEDFGEVVKLVCAQDKGPDWVFEKSKEADAGDNDWQITAPFQAKAAGWQVKGIAGKLTGARYKIKYLETDSEVTPKRAGLEPPKATVTLFNEKGDSVTVQVGRVKGEGQTFVRLGDAGDLYLVTLALDRLLKEKLVEYRDNQLFSAGKEHIQRLEIIERDEGEEATTFVLVRSGDSWTFEAPFKAAAVKEKIDAAAGALATMRVAQWVEADVANLGMYGLDAPALTVRARVEEPAPEPEANKDENESGEEDQPPAPPIVSELVLYVSGRSPIGDATKVFVRQGGDRAVGMMTKSLVDRLRLNPVEWRDMRVSTIEATAADRVELTTADGSAVLVKKGTVWEDQSGQMRLDTGAVNELLAAIYNLKAQNFVEMGERSAGEFGLDGPQAVIRVSVPGVPEAEVIEVGGYTDPVRRRMVYVRRSHGDSIAKVRVADMGKLTRPLADYRDRTILSLNAGVLERIAISRADEVSGSRFEFGLAQRDGRLQISEPAALPTQAGPVNQITGMLKGLSATRVLGDVPVQDYGLDEPVVRCEIRHLPPESTKLVQVEPEETGEPEKTADGSTGEEEGSKDSEAAVPTFRPEKYQPPAQTYTLEVGESGGKVYAKLAGKPTVYEVARQVLTVLQAELHEPAVFAFEESQVETVTVSESDGLVHRFVKEDAGWQYEAEPDLPIDPKRVQDLLLRLKDIKTERYVSYAGADAAAYGLDQAWKRVAVKVEGGAEQALLVSAGVCEQDPDKRHYAMLEGSEKVFLISSDTIGRFDIDLAEFEKS
ncbi:MAG: DUF4340 domain-containing protein [Phycisphaerae bacterium]